MKTKNILLPLIPGVNDEGLIQSGIKLANALKAKLTFLYVLTGSNYAAYAGSMAVGTISGIKEQKEDVENHYMKTLRTFKDDISAGMAIERVLVEGPYVSSILSYADNHEADILLLRHEEHGLLEKILGDSNTEIINAASIPVWVIPEQIAYISDHRRKDVDAIKQLQDLCKAFNATFYLMHVNDKDDFDGMIKKEGFKVILEKEMSDCKINHMEISRDELSKGINDIINEKNIDLICMANESDNFLHRFFTRSSVEKLMDEIDIPLAIFS